ncbi:MAG: hypothetical protein LBI03_10700, partial [Clostridiales bacterium]|nr:hypothetical protein [Clostridiales bacterium]
MKTYRTTIIVLCVMVVAIAAFFTVKALIPENSKPLQDPDDALAENLFSSNFNDINFEDVVKLEGVGDESYTVEDVNQHWLCVSNSSTIINSVNVEDII